MKGRNSNASPHLIVYSITIQRIEKFGDIRFVCPLSGLPNGERLFYCLPNASALDEPVAGITLETVPGRSRQYVQNCSLDDSIFDGRNADNPVTTVRLRLKMCFEQAELVA